MHQNSHSIYMKMVSSPVRLILILGNNEKEKYRERLLMSLTTIYLMPLWLNSMVLLNRISLLIACDPRIVFVDVVQLHDAVGMKPERVVLPVGGIKLCFHTDIVDAVGSQK